MALVLVGTISALLLIVFLTPSPEDIEESIALVPGADESTSIDVPANSNHESSRPSLITRIPQEGDVSACRRELTELVATLKADFQSMPEAIHLAASVCMELTESKQAEQLWRRCLEFSPRFAGPYVGLATILFERGDDDEGLKLLSESKGRFDPTVEYFIELIKALDRSGETELAMSTVQNALELFPNNGPLWYQRGLLERQLSQVGHAELSLRKAYELGDRSSACLNALSAVLARLGKNEEAEVLLASQKKDTAEPVENFQQLYDKKLKELAAYFFKEASLLAIQASQPAQAEKWLLISLSYAPKQPDVWIAMSTFLRKQNRLEEALESQQVLIGLQSDNVVNYANAASVASQLKRWDTVESILRDAVARFPKIAYLRGELASACIQRGAFTQGRQNAIAASELEPHNVEWQLMALVACEALGDVTGRDLHLQQAIKIAPNDPRVQAYIRSPKSM